MLKPSALTAPMWAAILRRESVAALSFTQPWASLVATGAKCYETRSWAKSYRGPLAIHAAKKLPDDFAEICYDKPFQACLQASGYQEHEANGQNPWQLETGQILAIAWLDRVVQTTLEFRSGLSEQEQSFGNFAPGRYAWHFSHIYRLQTPQPARGSLNIWQWQPSEAAIQEFQAQLALALTTTGGTH
jgi:hypothetical protein